MEITRKELGEMRDGVQAILEKLESIRVPEKAHGPRFAQHLTNRAKRWLEHAAADLERIQELQELEQ
jgi:hypothetical protein